MDDYANLIENIVKILGALVALWGFAKGLFYIVKKIISHFSRINSFFDLIERELKSTPTGNSLVDKVNKITESIFELKSRQKAQDSLSESLIIEVDTKGKATSVNKTFLRLLGAIETEVLGYGYRAFIADEDRERVTQEIDLACEEERECKLVFRFVNAESKYLCILMELVPVRDSQDKLRNYYGLATQLSYDRCE